MKPANFPNRVEPPSDGAQSRREALTTLFGPLATVFGPMGAATTAEAFAGKGQEAPPDRQRFLDAATEFEIVRLTKPDYDAMLPPSTSRAIGRRGDFLLCTSNRFGALHTIRIDLRTGGMRQVTEIEGLQPELLHLASNERHFYCGTKRTVYQVTMGAWRERELFTCPAGRRTGLSLTVTDAATWLAVEEWPEGANLGTAAKAEGKADVGTEVRLVPIAGGAAGAGDKSGRLVQVKGSPISLAFQPKGERLLVHSTEGLFLVEPGSGSVKGVSTQAGRVLQAHWAPEGNAVLYVLMKEQPANPEPRAGETGKASESGKAGEGGKAGESVRPPTRLMELREVDLTTGQDNFLARTSQYAQFVPNGDATVFLGASASRGAPYLLLLLRKVRRELPLCEHRSSDPRPAISANSQRVVFQTDRHGKMVIYMVAVERLLERTGEEAEEEEIEPKNRPRTRRSL